MLQLMKTKTNNINADFKDLYQQMNGMPLREMDNIIHPVCKLCGDHERAGFVEGSKIGIRLQYELAKSELHGGTSY